MASKKTAVAVPVAPEVIATTSLITIDPQTYVAQVYESFFTRLSAAIASSKDVTYEITTKAGMEVAKAQRALFRDIRIESEKARVARKAPIIEIGKLLDSKAKEIVQQAEPHESRFDTDIKAEEKRLDDEKAAKIKAEAERQSALQVKIDAIKCAPMLAMKCSSAEIESAIEAMAQIKATEESFAERCVEAELVLEASISQLRMMYEGKKAQEQLAAQVEAQRIENERLARIAAEEKAKAEALARAAQEAEALRMKAEREELDRQFAELERQKQLVADAQAKMEEEAKAKADAEAAAKLAQEDFLIKSLWENARRIESNSVPYIEKSIAQFESAAKDWENDPRQRVAHAVSEARKEMQEKLSIAKTEAEYQAKQKVQGEVAMAKMFEEVAKAEAVTSPQVEFTAGIPPLPDHDNRPETTLIEKAKAISGAGTLRNPRPTDAAIIAAIATTFCVTTDKACDWIFEVAEAMKVAA